MPDKIISPDDIVVGEDWYKHAKACVNACRGFDPQEERYLLIAHKVDVVSEDGEHASDNWNHYCTTADMFGGNYDQWIVVRREDDEQIGGVYKTEAEALCRAAIAAGIEINGVKITEEYISV